jgi:hypothetical protein
MPDPAKSVGDIDDVLSSIRRLVAEQPGPKWRDTEGAADGAVRPSADDRLVLTPALRVTDSTAPAEVAPPAEEPAQDEAEIAGAVADLDLSGDDAPAAEPGESDKEAMADPVPEAAADYADPVSLDTPDEVGAVAEAEATDAAIPDATAVDAAPVMTEGAPAQDALGTDAVIATPQGLPDPHEAASELADATHDATDMAEAIAANDAGSPDVAVDQPPEDLDSGASPVDEPASRVVGDDGWRPEMRLFDWEASAETAEDAPDPVTDTTPEFESETGDANWPDETADRAVLDLAAVREGEAAVAPSDPGTDSLAAAAAVSTGFTPIFSRRATDPDAAVTPPAADGVEDPLADAEPIQGVPDAMAEDGGDPMAAATPSQAEDDTAAETRVNLWDPGADTFHLVDDVADDTTAADDSAGTDDVAFSSVREVTTTEAAQGVPGPTVDDGPQVVTAPDDVVTPEAAGVAALAASSDHDEIGEDADGDTDAPDTLDMSFLEEEVLRRIVAEAVREELQGALGERITRNVRKLVRREIRLVLAVDELD